MNKLLCIIILITLGINTSSQTNLVLNPSFEDTIACPNNLDQLNLSVGWNSFGNTPDYFNACSAIGGISGVPFNQFDFQDAKTGGAYAGLFSLTTPAVNYREFLGGQLTQPLIVGHRYEGSFYVSRVENNSQHKNIATNNIGILLSTVPFSALSPAPIINWAHIYTDSIITDTLNWYKISGSFIADSSYQYLIIGNFFSDSLTSFIKYDSSATGAYYFIDDIKIIDSIVENTFELDLYSNIKIFPNPAHDCIEINVEKDYKINLYNYLGQIYFSNDVLAYSDEIINISTFVNGIYFMQFIDINDPRIYLIQKIIVN
jgi:hypothetical protein